MEAKIRSIPQLLGFRCVLPSSLNFHQKSQGGNDSKSVWEQSHVGSNPTRCATSEQAMYRLLRLFLKVRARSRRCSSFPTATRCAGFAVGGPPCGRHFSRLRNIDFNHPFQLVASDISLATSFFISLQSASRAHSAAPRFQTEPASLSFGLVPPFRGGFSFPPRQINFNRLFFFWVPPPGWALTLRS